MSRCVKSSLGSCCRLLLERDLKKRPGSLNGVERSRGHGVTPSVGYVQVGQGLESSEGELGQSLNVVILNEPAEEKSC